MKFNHLTVISFADYRNHTRYWLCECDCKDKTRKEIAEPLLVLEYTKSCGCLIKNRKNTEKYKLELEEINKKNGTNIRLKEGVEYVKNRIPITHICTCGKEWDVKPNHILSGNTTSCSMCYTFEDFCLENNRQDVLDRWDYELNDKKPNEITHATANKYYFKCPRGIHKSELNRISDINTNRNVHVYCRQCNSFEQWCLDNNRQDVLDRWDYELNNCKPSEVSYGSSRKKYYFKCPKGLHKSELKNIASFTNSQEGVMNCNQCGSFAQWGLNNIGIDFLDKYWDYEKNTVNPWEISYSCGKKVFIKCQEKDYHGSYPIQCNNFINGKRCGYCKGDKLVHPLDSLGKLLEDKDLLHLWSDKNNKSPYKYTPWANQDTYWKCPEGKHKDYPRSINSSNKLDFKCPECSRELKESIMATTLKQVLKHEYPNTIWEHNAGFRTPKNYISRYDIFVPELDNLLIECQSWYHDDPEKQKIDKLKKQYAIDNSYNYMAIDNRDYTPLKAIQIFFPEIKEIPDYIDLLRDTMINWDLKEAQKLLNEGYTYQEVADIIGVSYSKIQSHTCKGRLEKPKEYKIKRYDKRIKIVCLDKKDDKLIKIYDSISEAAIDIKNNIKSGNNIRIALKNKNKTAYGFKWMEYNEYIELNNNLNT